MVSITLSVSEEQFRMIEESASNRHQLPEELVRQYVDYLVAGGNPLKDPEDIPTASLMRLAEIGGSFDWLKDEPDLYTLEDGEPI